jgi:non-specific serine/threonine protein kinase
MPQQLVTSILFDGTLALEWEESTLAASHDRAKLEKLLIEAYKSRTIENPAQWLLVLGQSDESIPLSPSLTFWREFAAAWLHHIRTQPDAEEKRDNIQTTLNTDDGEAFLGRMPVMVGIDLVDLPFLIGLWNRIRISFVHGIRSFTGSVEEFFATLAPIPKHVDRIHFHLVENRKDDRRPFAFLATYSTRVDEQGRTRHLPLKHAFDEYADNNDKLLELLATVNKVAKKNQLIASMVDSGEIFKVIGLTPPEAMGFLEGVADFEAAGILCRIPRWWKGSPKKIAVTLSIGNKKPSRIGYDALLDFDAGLHLDGEQIDESEARRIIEQAEGLVLVKGKWVPVDVDSLRATLDALKQARTLAASESISFADAMRILMGAKAESGAAAIAGTEINCGEWLKSVLEKMANPSLIRETQPSPGLKANLRHYQQQGLNWLAFMQSLGFGMCLADDMGLGKTVQMLAHLQKLKQKGKGRTSLIVVPASLLENWRKEIEKFTPDLRMTIIHPQLTNKEDFDDLQSHIADFDLAITTYGMLSRCAWLTDHEWFHVICDEAQAIKNPTTKKTRAVKNLKSKNRCVMTGTPVENRLTDLWSLFDFINPGLLGSFGEFKTFAKSLDDNPEGFGRLRRVVHPYILRRSKTDKSIISDLPDKVEMKTWCTLSKHQTIIYEQLVKKLDHELGLVEGIKRKGLVLGYLMKCKQLCNHPDHYSGSGGYRIEESGKFQRLAELCETIHDKREKMLVFTQFAEIIDPLSQFLENLFGSPGLTLSGSTSVKKRKDAVERFQGGDYVPFFILSLKAGGVGLNLTEANHVVHFDRWWNPAVENQATDRAFRIGQKKNVMVHKFICKGTIEEKIDALIEDKKKLAGEIIPSAAENWITDLDDKQIKEMFRLTISSADIA